MTHTLAGARGTVRDRDGLLQQAQAWAAARGSEVLLADAAAVFGRDHLESAAFHAERAQATGTMATRSVSMEALLYLSGRRQVAEAIQAAGIREGTKAAGIIVFGGASVDDVIAHLAWSRDDAVLSPSGKDPSVLGIADAERTTVPEERVVDLALERTALVDLTK